MYPDTQRLHHVDALRGFAILAIMLLHNIEHFDFYFTPTGLPAWMQQSDRVIWDGLFFLFGGKAYAIFALLFGLTFSIQLDRQISQGRDFRGRFSWRLLLLFGFGVVNSAIYQGDILMLYALVGFVLIPIARLGNRTILVLAVLFMLQPYGWYHVAVGLQDPARVLGDPASWAYFGRAKDYLAADSAWNTWIGNLTNGRMAVFLWTWEHGRFFQTASLFMLGLLAGRSGVFRATPAAAVFWRRTLAVSVVAFVVFYAVNRQLPGWVASEAVRRPLGAIIKSWSNMGFMFILVSGFILLYRVPRCERVLGLLAPLGRMSLTNYILQSVLGTTIYYGFGMGLYQYAGSTYCVLIGLVLAALQILFSAWWLRRHKLGPLETLWHRATWMRLPGAAAPAARG